MKHPFIALLTDFGTEDGYVAAMKGRILSEAPEVRLIDISHSIKPFNVRQAAFCLNNSYPYFPEKTIFVVVVDPGVGTSRQGIVVKTSQHCFIGPDNGVFSFVIRREGFQAFRILLDAFAEPVSPTFHGRDVFVRIAAWLANGQTLPNYLSPLKKIESFLNPPQKIGGRELMLEVFHIDHFGNMVLNLHRNDLLEYDDLSGIRVRIGDVELNSLLETFGAAEKGALLLSWDSSDFLQIAQNMGSAAKQLNAAIGDRVHLSL